MVDMSFDFGASFKMFKLGCPLVGCVLSSTEDRAGCCDEVRLGAHAGDQEETAGCHHYETPD